MEFVTSVLHHTFVSEKDENGKRGVDSQKTNRTSLVTNVAP